MFDLLKTAFGGDPGHIASDRIYPMGFLQLNAMRLADIFSDDSNFRSYMTNCFVSHHFQNIKDFVLLHY